MWCLFSFGSQWTHKGKCSPVIQWKILVGSGKCSFWIQEVIRYKGQFLCVIYREVDKGWLRSQVDDPGKLGNMWIIVISKFTWETLGITQVLELAKYSSRWGTKSQRKKCLNNSINWNHLKITRAIPCWQAQSFSRNDVIWCYNLYF